MMVGRRHGFWRRGAAAALGALLAAQAAGPAWADGGTVTQNQAQLSLYKEALGEMEKGNYPRAVELLQAALLIGEANIVYLSLGRAHQKGGECRPAEEAFKKALGAPVVADPPADKVKAKIEQFRAELRQGCPGAVQVTCANPDTALLIDGKPLACGEVMDLPPGDHTLSASLQGQSLQQPLRLEALQTTTFSVTLDVKEVAQPDPIKDPGPQDPKGPEPAPRSLVLPITLGAVGGGLLVGGLVFGALVQETNDDLSSLLNDPSATRAQADELTDEGTVWQTLQFASYGLGLVSLGASAYFLLLSDGSSEPTSTGVVLQGPWVTPEAAGWGLQGRF